MLIKIFNLGLNVVTKKTGYPGSGEVVGIIHPSLYMLLSPSINFDRPEMTWNMVYSDWKTKPIYYIYFRERRKTVTYEEIKESYPEMTEYEVQEKYNELPTTNVIAYPHDDLELFEE